VSEQMLSKSQVEFYRANGYVVVEGLLTSARIAALRAIADRWVEASRAVNTADEVFDLEPGHSSEAPKVRRVKDPAAIDETYGELVRSPALLDLVEQLVGPNIRRLGSKLNMKSAGFGSPVEWHQDWAFYPHTNDDLLAVGVAIDGMTVENGCLLVVPGSHKGPVLDHHAKGRFVGAVEPRLIDLAAAVPLEAAPGSVTIHHVRLVHGSAPNTSGQPRRLFLIEYGAADAWPLVAGNWEVFTGQVVRGATSPAPRMEALPIRVPLPEPKNASTIYELQADEPTRRSDFAVRG
jgi:phytanoyl-CoA hydroxylase